MADRVSVFSTGSQHGDWTANNCEHCKRAALPDVSSTTCDIEAALWAAYMNDGKVSAEIAKRMGDGRAPDGGFHYSWPCGEVESKTEEHAAIVAAWRKKHQPAPLVTHHTEDGQIVVTRDTHGA